MYIQSALDMPTKEIIEQETNIRDGFPKIVIVGVITPSYVNDDSISIINVIELSEECYRMRCLCSLPNIGAAWSIGKQASMFKKFFLWGKLFLLAEKALCAAG